MDFVKDTNHNIADASGQKLEAYGTENAIVSTRNDPKNISNVVYIPGFKTNLLSVSKMIKKQHIVVFNSESCQVYDKNKRSKKKRLLQFLIIMVYIAWTLTESNMTKNVDSQVLWSKRLGYLNRISMSL